MPMAASSSRMCRACSATVWLSRARPAELGTLVGRRQLACRTFSTAIAGLPNSAIHCAIFWNSPACWCWESKQSSAMSAPTRASRALSSSSPRSVVRPQPWMPGVSITRQLFQVTCRTVVVQSLSPGEIDAPSPSDKASSRLLLPTPVRPNNAIVKASMPSSCSPASSVSWPAMVASSSRSCSRTTRTAGSDSQETVAAGVPARKPVASTVNSSAV